ncbi:MAG: hypothetical protein IJ770_03820 [Alphaproteobacteria bacterium]|nr:hypothetical protein [Alphaproteobacteria bacterium]
MKKFVKFLTVVFTIALVLVPVTLLAGGLYLGTGPVWDVLMIAGICTVLAFAFGKFRRVQKAEERAEQARFMVGLVGVLCSFLPLAAQAIFCRIGTPAILVCESAMVWLFLLMTIGLINALMEEQPDNSLLKWAIVLATAWIAICALGGILDFYEYFSGCAVPERLCGILGVLAPVTGIGAFVFGFFGVLKANMRR